MGSHKRPPSSSALLRARLHEAEVPVRRRVQVPEARRHEGARIVQRRRRVEVPRDDARRVGIAAGGDGAGATRGRGRELSLVPTHRALVS